MKTNISVAESKSEAASMDKEQAMQRMKAAGTLGPAHRALDEFVGNWEVEVKCWMDPNGEPNVSRGTADASWILDEHFLQEEFHGEMMGKPFDGRMFLGFDNTKEKFNCVWIDSMNTAMSTSEGPGADDYKTITLEGRVDCPVSGQRDMPVKQVFRVINHDQRTLEMFNNGQKTMEINYKRW